jgi:phosphoglycolate phosphatase
MAIMTNLTIRGILFDKDGTLIDFPSTWTPVLKALSLEFAKGDGARAGELMETAGYDPDSGMFKPGSIWAAGNTLDLVTAWLPDAPDGERADIARWVDDYCERIAPDTAVPITDLVRFFGALRQSGLALGVATNDVTRSALATMQRFGVADLLVAVLGYDSVARPKPAADMVVAFCAEAAIDPGEVAVVGDNLHDLVMARAAGAGLAIGVLTGNGTRDDLGAYADHIIDSIEDLPRLLQALGASAPAALAR